MKVPLLQLASCALALGALLASPAPAQGVGSKIPKVELEGFTQTEAQTFDDYLGRAVLFEFFAFW
jgi:hypothetical protein